MRYQYYNFSFRVPNINNKIKNMNYKELLENKEFIVRRSKIFNNAQRKEILETLEKSLDYHEGIEQRILHRESSSSIIKK